MDPREQRTQEHSEPKLISFRSCIAYIIRAPSSLRGHYESLTSELYENNSLISLKQIHKYYKEDWLPFYWQLAGSKSL